MSHIPPDTNTNKKKARLLLPAHPSTAVEEHSGLVPAASFGEGVDQVLSVLLLQGQFQRALEVLGRSESYAKSNTFSSLPHGNTGLGAEKIPQQQVSRVPESLFCAQRDLPTSMRQMAERAATFIVTVVTIEARLGFVFHKRWSVGLELLFEGFKYSPAAELQERMALH